MIHQATKTAGLAVRRSLGGGLRIDVIIDEGQARVQISRALVYPSDREWETVLRAWPYQVPQVQPRRFSYLGRYYMAAELPGPGVQVLADRDPIGIQAEGS